MTDKELLQEALEALTYVGDKDIYSDTIDALRARLSQLEQEPVVWMDSDGFPWTKQGVECRTTLDTYTPLYTAPPQREWVGLTDGAIAAMADSLEVWDENQEKWVLDPNTFARAIEAKLKEKNT